TQPMPMNIRMYVCLCGLNLDRDYNSALNIKKEGIRLLATA
ncbi:transposase, partial [Aquibacillus sp. 3ASR75-11]|nr:transposase [Terrihalobacillus insolitus]